MPSTQTCPSRYRRLCPLDWLVLLVSVPEVTDWAVVMEGHPGGMASAGISLVEDKLLYPRF